MNNLNIIADDISKAFVAKKYIIKNISLSLNSGEILGISGANGSGKSTLIKIILGLVGQSAGKVDWLINGNLISKDDYNDYSGFAAPYLNLYEEFTPTELISVMCRLRAKTIETNLSKEMLDQYLLFEHRNKIIRDFSSGMKQRMKLLVATLHNPDLLVLDEPSSNLDKVGFGIVERMINDHKSKGGAVLLASNEDKELSLCDKQINVTTYTKLSS